MITRINGTEARQKMVSTIIENMRKYKPNMRHVDYTLSLRKGSKTSELITDENRGELRNVSLIYISHNFFLGKIKAAIGNKTGNVLLKETPILMSEKTALKKIEEFLTNLLPENRKNPEKVNVQTKTYGHPDNINVINTEEQFKDFDIFGKIDGSNYLESGEEIFEPYKTA